MHEMTVDSDRFAYGFDRLLEDIGPGIEDALEPAVRKGCQVARKTARAKAPKKTGRYAKSLSYKVKRGGMKSSGEVGSKELPGLVHLLEKGHAKVGGGSVAGRPHMVDGFDAGVPAFQEELMRGVERALS